MRLKMSSAEIVCCIKMLMSMTSYGIQTNSVEEQSDLGTHCLLQRRFNPYKPSLTFCGTSANSAKPDQTLQNAASDLVFQCLVIEASFKI